MYFYKIELIGYDGHQKTIYCSKNHYSDEEFKEIIKKSYIETCKYISKSGKAIFEFNYRLDFTIFDSLDENGDNNLPFIYFDNLLNEHYGLVNLDGYLDSKLIFGTDSFPNENTRDFYEERNKYDFVGLSKDDFKGYF